MELETVNSWLHDEPGWIAVLESAPGELSVRVGDATEVRLVPTADGRALHLRLVAHEERGGVEADTAAEPMLATILHDAFNRFSLTLGGLVDATIIETESGWNVELDARLYSDGLTRHTLLAALDQQDKAASAVRLLFEDVKAQFGVSAAVAATETAGRAAETEVSQRIQQLMPTVEQFTVGATAPLIDDEQEQVGMLEPGHWYEQLGEIEGWLETATADNSMGWVAADQVAERRTVSLAELAASEPPSPSLPPPGAPPILDPLGPSFSVNASTPLQTKDLAVIGDLEPGHRYPVLGEAQGWVRTRTLEGLEGWVAADRVDRLP